jgi:MFS family permease
MQQLALSWLVYRLTNSVFLLGLVGFSSQIPVFLVGPLAGVLVDRHNRRRILIGTQTLSMILAFVMAFLVLTNKVTVWGVIVVSLSLGLVNSADMPARQTFVLDMVEKREDLGNAIALNSSLFNVARLVGPSIAGILISIVGEGVCFLLNGISFLAVIICLLAMRVRPQTLKIQETHILQELREGFHYAFGFAPIRYIILLLALVSLVGMPYAVLMPVFAKEILHGGPNTLGFLMAAAGTGALVGAIYLASRKSVRGLGRIVAIAASIFGIGLIAFSFSRQLALSLILMMFTGFGMIVEMASSNTILQTITDDNKRGRVMSFYVMAFAGMAPFGSLLAGSMASKIGAPNTLLIGGVCCVLGALLFARGFWSLRGVVYDIYIKKGVISGKDLGIDVTEPR